MVIIASWFFQSNGVLVELYTINSGKFAVRMSDSDAGETVSITIYPSEARAKAGYEDLLQKTIAAGGC